MTANDYLQLVVFVAALLLLVKPLGAYMALVFADQPNRVTRIGAPVERMVYRLCGVDPAEDMGWKRYALGMLAFNALGLLAVYVLQRLQPWLPLNPQHFGAVPADSAMNTAISFATNTDWQGYGGESTMSYLTQMLGLAVQNFLSAATGIAVLVAVVRGFARRSARGLGNFWVDLVRGTLYVLLPLSLVLALLLVSQGVVQNFRPYVEVPVVQATSSVGTAADGAAGGTAEAEAVQTLPMGPAASQATGNQWRRLLQCELRAPVREPHAAFQLHRDAGDLPDSRRPVRDVRADGGRPPAGLGDPRHDVADLRAARRRRHRGGAGGQPGAAASGGGRQGIRAAVRRQHGRQGDALRHRILRPVRRGHHRRLLRRGERHA
jgi:hypothetical protein